MTTSEFEPARSGAVPTDPLMLWGLILASAACYVAAMVAMKHWGALPAPLMVLAIGGAMLLASIFEVLALRGERLGMIYAAILGAEVILLAAVATLVLGETFTLREVGGVALILGGAVLAWA